MSKEILIKDLKGNIESFYDLLDKLNLLDGCDDTKKQIIKQQIALLCINTIHDLKKAMPSTLRIGELID